MPPLPKILKKNEARVTPLIQKAMLKDTRFVSCGWEVKYVKGKTLGKGALQPRQYNNLYKTKSKEGLIHKMSDIARILQVFDGFLLRNAEGYLIIWYQLEIRRHEVYAIPVLKIEPGCAIPIERARNVGLKLTL